MRPNIPDKVLDLVNRVQAAGGRAFLVGGCVRDRLLGLTPKDWDVEVFGLEPEALRTLLDQFGEVNTVGEIFTVYRLGHDLDVSLPRRERKSGRGHRGFFIEGDPSMTIEDAARRRDFTINAILEDPLKPEILDPYCGRADLAKKLLRAVSRETFPEDSLRVLRAAELAARFELLIEPETVDLCRDINLTDLPRERIWGEMEKLLLHARKPSVGFDWLLKLGAVDQLFPEVQALIGVPQDPEWHPEGDVFVHTLLCLNRAHDQLEGLHRPRQLTVLIAALCHDFGKPATTAFEDGRWRSRGHDEAGIPPTESFLDRLNIHTLDGYDVRSQVIALVRHHLKPGELYNQREQIGDGAIRRLARKCEPDLLYRVAKADSLGRNAEWVPREKWFTADAQEWFIERVMELDVRHKPPSRLLMGRHLIEMGLTPSPRFGEILDAVYEMQLDGHVKTIEEAKAAARKLL